MGVEPIEGRIGVDIDRGGVMDDAQRLQRNRSGQLPTVGLGHGRGQPLGVGQVATEALLQRFDPVEPQLEEDLQSPEPSPEGDAPVPVLDNIAVGTGPQIAGVGGHDLDQELDVTNVEHRRVEDRAQPLVGVPGDRVGSLHTVPESTVLGQDHDRSGHGGVDVDPEFRGGVDDLSHRVDGSGSCGPDGRHHRRRGQTVAPVTVDTSPQVGGFHGERHVIVVDDPDVVGPVAGEQGRLSDRGVGVGGAVHHRRPVDTGQPGPGVAVAGGPLPAENERHQT